MNCPACEHELSEVNVGDIKLDVCQGGCGGLWFDNFELQKVDESHEHTGEKLLDIKRNPDVRIDNEMKRQCPRCSDIKMMRHFFTVKQKVTIDECAQCGGVWLDVGELAMIRSLYDSEEDRKKAADVYYAGLFDGPLADMKAKSDADLAKARKFAHMFRFICPTYYIPGKQDWGAF